MTDGRPTGIFVLGYGNPGRQDDGLGPALAEGIGALRLPGVTVDADYQLNIEDAATLAGYERVLFVDASKTAPEPFALERLSPAKEITFTSHSLSPACVLAMCDEHFGTRPEAWLLGIRGYAFDFDEGLSPAARANLEAALTFVQLWVRPGKERAMDSKQYTILTIDDDPDIRAALRVVLSSAGYSVGEAANAEEGLKAVDRVKPDAIIVDLMMEDVDSGSAVARELKESAFKGPVYMLSSAGDAVRYNVDARELGLAGIFQKPIDSEVLLATLKAKLQDLK